MRHKYSYEISTKSIEVIAFEQDCGALGHASQDMGAEAWPHSLSMLVETLPFVVNQRFRNSLLLFELESLFV